MKAKNRKVKRMTAIFMAAAMSMTLLAGCGGKTLTEEELSYFKRGRNAKTVSMAKHATMHDYRHATGFEALMGYLYLTDQMKRMIDLIKIGMERTGGTP